MSLQDDFNGDNNGRSLTNRIRDQGNKDGTFVSRPRIKAGSSSIAKLEFSDRVPSGATGLEGNGTAE